MTTLQKSLLFLLLIGLTNSAIAQESVVTNGTYTIETNPAYWILGGFSVKGYHHRTNRWSFGVQVEGGFELPEFARDQFFDIPDNSDVDWDWAFSSEVRFRLNENEMNKGFYLFGTLGYEKWTVSSTADQGELRNWFSSLGFGYTWYPFKKEKFHVGGSYNVIFLLNNTNERTLNNITYELNSIVPPSLIPNLTIGWRF